MTLYVHVTCGYPYIPDFYSKYTKPDDSEWAAFNLIKTAKGEPIKGYCSIVDENGKSWKIQSGEQSVAINLFGNWAGVRLAALGIGACTLVPVPSSTQTELGGDCTALKMALAVTNHHSPASVQHVLAFIEAKQSDHTKRAEPGQAKAPRQSKQEILDNLKSQQLVGPDPIILVDDVYTMGRHLKACATYLRNEGHKVETALCLGRTIWDRVPNIFQLEHFDAEPNPFAGFGFSEETDD